MVEMKRFQHSAEEIGLLVKDYRDGLGVGFLIGSMEEPASRRTVYRWLREAGVLRPRGRVPDRGDDERIRGLLGEGLSERDVAGMVEVSRSVVRRVRRG